MGLTTMTATASFLTAPATALITRGAITETTDPLLIAREGAAILQISVPTFWRRVADGTIPKPLKLGGLSRWPKSEILGVIETAKAARTAA
jgi:predicted DNA-binding transcriptional regulator AlpA